MCRLFGGLRGPAMKWSGKVRCPISAILVAMALAGCGEIDLKWSEEVQLTSAQVVVVRRTAKGEKLGELGGPGGWEQTEESLDLDIYLPATKPPTWRSRFMPIFLDYDEAEDVWSIVASFATCQGWYDLGRPKLPYIEYQSRNGGPWGVVPLEQRLVGRRANLLTGVRSGGEPAFLSLEDKKGRDGRAADEYRWIVASWRTTC